jgi:hypothetical protein
MREFTPQHKHNILTHYCAGVRGAGFAALARRFAVKGGEEQEQEQEQEQVSSRDGTRGGTERLPASLQEQPRSGRPRTLSRAEVR